ncbi:DUF1566 domain-containing protein [Methylomonas sp. MS20]|uniref:Lcl C-terminal domain-containing protein n=1 Tax=unclassified Methylomonas TaxID=2608980 RepID=UPI0028A5556A|nr:DUF1566 domain-containing protein [Methylomonas sp. MV1]MDT4329294.1 DUF1566 domain-containing protein [Methylomonas sp. MV1]
MTFKQSTKSVAMALVFGAFFSSANAALIDRGNGLLYDTVLDVTWLQNANLAATNTFGVSGINANGTMSWTTAQDWISAMNSANYLGYNQWRLPAIKPIDGSATNYNLTYATNGSSDNGFRIDSPYSELSYMYYVNLGLKPAFDANGNFTSDFGIFGNGTYSSSAPYLQNNVGLVQNLQAYAYWSGSPDLSNPVYAWWVNFGNGRQGRYFQTDKYEAWAVISGDVAAVPVPGALWLFGSAIASLVGLSRRQSA